MKCNDSLHHKQLNHNMDAYSCKYCGQYALHLRDWWAPCIKCCRIICGSCANRLAWCVTCHSHCCEEELEFIREIDDGDTITLETFCSENCKKNYYNVKDITSGKWDHRMKFWTVLENIIQVPAKKNFRTVLQELALLPEGIWPTIVEGGSEYINTKKRFQKQQKL